MSQRKRIAVIFEGNIYRRLGVFNAVVNRVKHLRAVLTDVDIDVVMIQGYDAGLNRLLHRTPRVASRPSSVEADGVLIDVRWFRHRLVDTVLQRVFHRQPWIYGRWLARLGASLDDYDLIVSHDRIASLAARHAVARRKRPWFITWHGASIYTEPYRHPEARPVTCELLHAPTDNFFVSRGLVDQAERLTTGFSWKVLANGASPAFAKFSDSERDELRLRYGLREGERVVAFVGRWEAVKNVSLLPDIVERIGRLLPDVPLRFWGIGDGAERAAVEAEMRRRGIACTFLGARPADEMPSLMNAMDLLLLPSRLEGMPLVAIEALQCGTHVVASDVVGNAEVVGSENAIALGDDFVEQMARRAATLLTADVEQPLPPHISWQATAEAEAAIYRKWLD